MRETMTTLPPLLSSLATRFVQIGLFPTQHAAHAYLLSLCALNLIYYTTVHVLGYNKQPDASMTKPDALKFATSQSKKRSWILTGTAAFCMTVCSVPSTWALISSGFDVAQMPERPLYSQAVVAFFMAYLNLDLIIGCMHYKRQITLLTGWVHHTAYTVLLWLLLRRGLCHVFAGAAIMELPTFVLALSMLVPALRSDMVFTSLFFVTRIVYHAVLLTLYWSPYGRANSSGLLTSGAPPFGSIVPAIGLSLAAPLHISWFSASVRGLLRRRRHRNATASAAVAQSSVSRVITDDEAALASQTTTKAVESSRPRLMSLASSYLASPRRSLHDVTTTTAIAPTSAMSAPFSSKSSTTSTTAPSPLSASSPIILLPRARTGPPARRPLRIRDRIEHEVRQFFLDEILPRQASRWIERDEHDVFKAQAVYPITKLRLRAGRGGDSIRRVGGRYLGRAVHVIKSARGTAATALAATVQ